MLEALIPGAAWRAIDWACRRLNISFRRADHVRIDIRRAVDRKRETAQLWENTRKEVEVMLKDFPLETRQQYESETRLFVSVRFRDAPDDGNGQSVAASGM